MIQQIQDLGKNLVLQWNPAHCNIQGNEKADMLAKKGSNIKKQLNSLRPGADQSSKTAFGKSAFVKTCSNVLSFVKDMTGAHQSSKRQKYFRAHFGTCNEQNAFC